MSATPKQSKDLAVGTIMEHRNGHRVTLDHRKSRTFQQPGEVFHPGWWCTDGSGLADFVIDAEDSDWRVISR